VTDQDRIVLGAILAFLQVNSLRDASYNVNDIIFEQLLFLNILLRNTDGSGLASELDSGLVAG
jgi:hypothetical protein